MIKISCQARDEPSPRLILKQFSLESLSEAVEYIRNLLSGIDKASIYLTGGGAQKFRHRFQFGDQHQYCIVDEFRAVGCGIPVCMPPHTTYPFIAANVGSGVSILLVESQISSKRVSGTALGGATFVGLGQLLAGNKSYFELLDLCMLGSSKDIDMTVGDIYGGDLPDSELKADITASYFAKIQSLGKNIFLPEDVLHSLMKMLSYNLAQILVLNARLFNVRKILVFGGFAHCNCKNLISIFYFMHFLVPFQKSLEDGVKYWSKGLIKVAIGSDPLFVGSIGAMMST